MRPASARRTRGRRKAARAFPDEFRPGHSIYEAEIERPGPPSTWEISLSLRPTCAIGSRYLDFYIDRSRRYWAVSAGEMAELLCDGMSEGEAARSNPKNDAAKGWRYALHRREAAEPGRREQMRLRAQDACVGWIVSLVEASGPDAVRLSLAEADAYLASLAIRPERRRAGPT
jgi:hypothetical protein